MAENKGKKFEAKFRADFLKSVPNSTIDRLYDQVSGYKTISNISDFIGYSFPNIFYLECKSIKGNTFPLANLTQYDKLIVKVGIKGVRVGVVIWFYDKDVVMYVPINTVKQLFNDGKKSINCTKILEEGYRAIIIPSEKKRTYMDSDYSVLMNLGEND